MILDFFVMDYWWYVVLFLFFGCVFDECWCVYVEIDGKEVGWNVVF